jgi:carbonic anhydrase
MTLALALLLSSGSGCHDAKASAPAPEPSGSAAAGARKSESRKRDAHAKQEPAEAPSGDRKFMVPFSWEAKKDDPLAQTRSFMKDAFDDNASYVKAHTPRFFEEFREAQHPRATLVTCADSRVQNGAVERSPENDIFTIRNIGNQISSNVGSVEYGVRHLKTPLLMVLGHSRCGAVKAAMGDTSEESEAIRKELETLHVHKAKLDKEGKAEPDPELWLTAVKENVNQQVTQALAQFASDIEQGNLTVVGAVYDFADDFHRGAGTFNVINVNGNTEPARVTAFSRAVQGLPPIEEAKDGEAEHSAQAAHGKDATPSGKQLARLQALAATSETTLRGGAKGEPGPEKRPAAEHAPAAHAH